MSEVINSLFLSSNKHDLIMNNLASSLMLLGDYIDAEKIANKCLNKVEMQREARWILLAKDTYGCILAVTDKNREGERLLMEVISEAKETTDNAEMRAVSLGHLGTLVRRRGDCENTLIYHNQCVNVANTSNEKYEQATGIVNQGADLMRLNRSDEAEVYFAKAEELAQEYDFGYVPTHVDFHRAWAAHLRDDEENLLKHLRVALRRASEHQHNHFIIQEGKICLPLFSVALANNIEPDYTYWVLAQIGAAALPILTPFLNTEQVNTRSSVVRAIRVIGDPAGLALLRKAASDSDEGVRREAQAGLAELRRELKSPVELLTSREAQVLELLAFGISNGQITERLFLSEPTVKTHVSRIFKKLGLSNRLEAVLFYQLCLAMYSGRSSSINPLLDETNEASHKGGSQ